MSKINDVINFRNQLHKEIVQLGIKIAGAADQMQLELNEPIQDVGYRDDQDSRYNYVVRLTLLGIDCTTGELLAETHNFEGRRLRYCDLTVEQLAQLYDRLEAELFTKKQLEPC